ncbi:hypothetical protein C6501_08225 [Candidatus Poribacteria bacterium]|nr:MAG: hypothetical protein C6501_08225 [Candidatus Poribacteria bacterium]
MDIFLDFTIKEVKLMRNFIVMLFTAVLLAASLQITCAAEELKGLVVYFDFEDGAGETVTDQSGNGQNGLLEGDTDWTKGKYGKGLNFGGENGIVRVVHSRQFEFTEGITICAWIRPTLKRGPGEWQLIAAKGPDVDEFFEILLHPDGFIWMGWELSDGRVVPQKSLNKIAKDEWQHVAVSFQRGEWWTVYLDGEVLINHPKQNSKLVPVESPLLLGTEEPLNLNRYYNGDMDEFAMFNRGLSQKEIRKIQEGIEDFLAVEPTDKLSTSWGILKQKYNMRSVSN